MTDKLCGCIKCTDARRATHHDLGNFSMPPGFRYACELCGNKRCPHHSDHTLACTGSNEPGQPGSVFM